MNDKKPWQQQADAWLRLVDSLDAHASWKSAAESFRSAVTPDEWAEQLRAVRKPLGALTSRRLAVEERATDLPGADPGDYVVQQYHAVYDNRQAVTETLTLQRGDAEWRVVGYYIR